MTTPITNVPQPEQHLISGAPSIGTKNLSWRLGRKKAADPRDRQWSATKVVPSVADPRKSGIQLRTVARAPKDIPEWARDLPHLYRHHKRGPQLDQDGWSACTWYTMGGAIAAGPIMQDLGKLAAKFGFPDVDTFLRQSYLSAQDLDEWVGREPQYYGTSLRAALKVGQNLGFWPNYYWLNGITELARYVVTYAPSPLAMDWFSGMYQLDKHGYIEPNGTWEGGHAMLCDEVSITEKYIGGPQTWGPSAYLRWKMSFDSWEYLASQGAESAAMPETRILLPPTVR
jgi:hypothetical protein